jgi:hypothetical protein
MSPTNKPDTRYVTAAVHTVYQMYSECYSVRYCSAAVLPALDRTDGKPLSFPTQEESHIFIFSTMAVRCLPYCRNCKATEVRTNIIILNVQLAMLYYVLDHSECLHSDCCIETIA